MKAKQIGYSECTDTEILRAKGITTLPMLEVDGTLLSFGEAVKYINNLEAVS